MSRVLVLLTVLLLTACEGREPPPPEEQSIRPARILVVGTAGETEQHEFVARIEAAQTIDVSFEVAGPLAQLPILEGQTISEGGLIAALSFLLAAHAEQVWVSPGNLALP